jgi:sRNA-binding regulator protein Hfq
VRNKHQNKINPALDQIRLKENTPTIFLIIQSNTIRYNINLFANFIYFIILIKNEKHSQLQQYEQNN